MTVNPMAAGKVYTRSFFNRIYAQMVPCVLCARPAPPNPGLCADCQADLPWLRGPLCRCALPCAPDLPRSDDALAPVCGRCLADPPPFLGIQAALAYGHPLAPLVNRWKHRQQLALSRPLAALLASVAWLPDTDMVVPVPLHWRRQWQRGFNQAALLAATLARRQRRPLVNALRRRHDRAHQQGQSARQRRQAGSGVYQARGPLTGRRILLVDDVVTTGATVRAATRALLDAGADSVSVVALARVLPP